jgi:hypothetical protein
VAATLLGTLLLSLDAPWKVRVLVIGTAALVIALGLAPWTIRNYAVHHAFVPVSTFAGTSLLLGNNPFSTGTTALPREFYEWAEAGTARLRHDNHGTTSEVEQESINRTIALDWIATHPVDWARLLARKARVFWIYPVTTTADDYRIQLIAMAGDAFLWAGVIAGIVALWYQRRMFNPMLAVIAVVSLAHVMMHTEARYRLPSIALLTLIAGPGIEALLDRGKRIAMKTNRSGIFCAAGILTLLLIGYCSAALMFIHGEV